MKRPVTVLVSASGAPGTAALLRALRENGEREVRLVGTDMSERSVGRHLCDAFHLVPAGSDPGFADAMLDVAAREGVDASCPSPRSTSRGSRRTGPVPSDPVLVSPPDAIRRSNDKAETYALLHRIGVPAPAFRRVSGAARSRRPRASSATPIGRCASSRCSRRARAASASSTRRSTARTSCCTSGPGSVAMRLEEALELLPARAGPSCS